MACRPNVPGFVDLVGCDIEGGSVVAVALIEDSIVFDDTNDRLGISSIQFDLTPTESAAAEGKLVWNLDDGTLNLGMPGGEVNGQILQEMFVPKRPKNVSGGVMPNGTVVYVSGSTGAVPEISLADASTEALSNATIGLTTEDIDDNGRGYVTTIGLVRGSTAQPIDTSTFAAGEVLWLSEVAGEFTDVKPSSPAHAVVLGKVIRVHATEGEIYVQVNNGFELFELHDVSDSLSSPTDKAMLAWNNTNSLWEQTPQLFYDFANDRLGIGTATPTGGILHIVQKADTQNDGIFVEGTNGDYFKFYINAANNAVMNAENNVTFQSEKGDVNIFNSSIHGKAC